MFDGKIHCKWPFRIATLNYQRVGFMPQFGSAKLVTIPARPSCRKQKLPLVTVCLQDNSATAPVVTRISVGFMEVESNQLMGTISRQT